MAAKGTFHVAHPLIDVLLFWWRLSLHRLLMCILYSQGGEHIWDWKTQVGIIIVTILLRYTKNSSKALEIYPFVGKYVPVSHEDVSLQLLSGHI